SPRGDPRGRRNERGLPSKSSAPGGRPARVGGRAWSRLARCPAEGGRSERGLPSESSTPGGRPCLATELARCPAEGGRSERGLPSESSTPGGRPCLATELARCPAEGGRMSGALIRLIVVDDHPVVRDGIRGMLERDERICVVGEAADGH